MAGYSAFTEERNEFSQLTRDCKIVVGLYFTLWCKNAFFLTLETNAIKCTSKSTQGAVRESYDVKSDAKICGYH